jgi:hypothetical protein
MIDANLRRLIRERAEHRCEYCRLPEEAGDVAFHVEHIVARQHHGTDDLSNLALACDRCNLCKGPNLSTNLDGETIELFHPRRDVWTEHFRAVGAEIVGLTRTGQATVQLLKMNALRRIALRQRWLNQIELG